MTEKRKRVVLVSSPGLVQRATESTLAACPGVELVSTVPGALSATGLLLRTQPDLLLLDATLADEELEALLSWVKVRYPEVFCAALTASTRQRERVLGWGADVVIHRGDLTGQLQELLGCCPA